MRQISRSTWSQQSSQFKQEEIYTKTNFIWTQIAASQFAKEWWGPRKSRRDAISIYHHPPHIYLNYTKWATIQTDMTNRWCTTENLQQHLGSYLCQARIYILALGTNVFLKKISIWQRYFVVKNLLNFNKKLVCSVNACVYIIQAPPNARYHPYHLKIKGEQKYSLR